MTLCTSVHIFRTIFFLWVGLLLSTGTVHGQEKTLEKVFHPERFPPFAMAPHMRQADFDHFWEVNRPWVLANLAHAAYHTPKTITDLVTRFGAQNCYFYNRHGAQAYLALWADKAILAFRGTQIHSMNDLSADILFLPTPYGTATVHRGFLRELNKLWPQIEADLQRYTHSKTSNLPVWATGHSLGGALATLAGMRVAFESVVTFGEPPAGRRLASMFLSKHHARYINGDDPIPQLPGIMNEHHGKPIQITPPDTPADWRYDHAIIYYAENLFTQRL